MSALHTMSAKANLKLRPVNQTAAPSSRMSLQPLDSLPPSSPPLPTPTSTPTPKHAHTSHLSFPPAVSHTVSQSLPPPLCDAATPPPPLPAANALTADWSFQVTSGLFPCPLNITGWLRPRNPAWAREGVEVHPHTHKHTCTQGVCGLLHTGATGQARTALCSMLSSTHLSSSSGYPWWCGLRDDTYLLLDMYRPG